MRSRLLRAACRVMRELRPPFTQHAARSLALIVALAACEIEKTSIPRTQPLVAVHAVLSATAGPRE